MVRRRPFAVVAFAALLGGAAPPDGSAFMVEGDGSARISWLRHFASANNDWINDLVEMKGGHVLAVGFLNRSDQGPSSDWQALAASLTPGGRVLTERTHGEGSGIDAFWAVAEGSDGRRMFAGFTTRIGAGGIDALTVLADSGGTPISERAFGGAGYDRFTSVVALPDGFVFLGHSQAEGDDKRRIFVVKTGLDGQALWERVHDAPESWGALYIARHPDGGLIVAGGTEVKGDGDMFAMKLDRDGQELWRRRAGTAEWDEINHGLVVRPDGSIVLAGYTHRRGEQSNDLVAAILSADGSVERIERFGGSGDDRAILAKPDSKGRIWIVGHSDSAGAGGPDLLLARLDSRGKFESAALTIGGAKADHGTAVLPQPDGSILLAGYSQGLGAGGEDAFVLKLSAPRFGQPNRSFRREVAVP